MRVLTIVNEAGAGPGAFAAEAAARGAELVEWAPPREPAPGGTWDALLVLGGSVQVDQQAEHPWLVGELDALRRALDGGVPVLGVCLGAQMLALAAGGEVGPSPEEEIGWYEVRLTEAGRADPVLGPLDGPVFQWHSYAFAPPPGAVALADSPVCQQAYRLGETAWGVQFHPEVTGAIVEEWMDDDGRPADDPVRARTREIAVEGEARGRALFARFLAEAAA